MPLPKKGLPKPLPPRAYSEIEDEAAIVAGDPTLAKTMPDLAPSPLVPLPEPVVPDTEIIPEPTTEPVSAAEGTGTTESVEPDVTPTEPDVSETSGNEEMPAPEPSQQDEDTEIVYKDQDGNTVDANGNPPPEGELDDLFAVPEAQDNDTKVDDLFEAPDEETSLDEDDLDDVFRVSQAEIMGTPPRRKKRIVRRVVRPYPPPGTTLGGMR